MFTFSLFPRLPFVAFIVLVSFGSGFLYTKADASSRFAFVDSTRDLLASRTSFTDPTPILTRRSIDFDESVFLVKPSEGVSFFAPFTLTTWLNVSATDFNAPSSWSSGSPAGDNVARFNSLANSQPRLSSPISIAGLNFTASDYDLTNTASEALTLTGSSTGSGTNRSNSAAIYSTAPNTNTIDVPIILAPGSGTTSTFNQGSGGTLVVNVGISGSGVILNLPSPGVVQFNGNNSYSGGTTIPDGTLQIGHNNALGTGALTVGGPGNPVLQSAGATRTISNDVIWGGTGTISGTNNLIVNGSFTGSGLSVRTITVNGVTATLNGNVYLRESDAAMVLTVAGTGNLVIGGNITNNNAGNTVASGITLANNATLALNGTNSYTGPTTLNAGTLSLGNKSAFGTGNVAWNGVTTSASTNLSGANAIANNGNFGAAGNIFNGTNSLELGGTLTNSITNQTITNNLSAGTLTLSGPVFLSNLSGAGRTINFSGSGATAITGIIGNFNGSGTASNLAYGGTGTLTLSNSNTYTGTTAVSSGKLLVTGSTSAASTVTVSGTGTLGGTGTVNVPWR